MISLFLFCLSGCYRLFIAVDDVPIQDSPFFINFVHYPGIATTPDKKISTNFAPQYIASDSSSTRQYLSTNQGHVLVYEKGKKVKEIPRSKLGGVNQLRGIAVDEKNNVMFIASAGANKVIKADLNGEVIATIGDDDNDSVKFQYPTRMCLAKKGGLLSSSR